MMVVILPSMPKIIHKRNSCTGCGVCASICPELFELSEKDGLAVLKNSFEKNGEYELEMNETDNIKAAANVCPVQAIVIEEN